MGLVINPFTGEFDFTGVPGLPKYASAAALPVTATEGDAAVTVDTGNIYTYVGGVWVQATSGSSTVTLDAEVQGLGFSLSGQ